MLLARSIARGPESDAGVAMNPQIRAVQEALNSGQDLLGQLLEHTPAPVAIFDRDMRYIMASRRYATDFHLDTQSLVGRLHY
jgi:two-component system, sensor histidine kinase and response regulator